MRSDITIACVYEHTSQSRQQRITGQNQAKHKGDHSTCEPEQAEDIWPIEMSHISKPQINSHG